MFIDLIEFLVNHPNEFIRSTASMRRGRIKTFLTYITISKEATDLIIECDMGDDGESIYFRIFPNGWLAPNGKFYPIGHNEHHETAKEVTGHQSADKACEAGWIKLLSGLPYNHHGECLLGCLSNKSKVTRLQRRWLDDHLSLVEFEKKSFGRFSS